MNTQRNIICPHCQRSNRPGELLCANCHRPLSSRLEQYTRTLEVDPTEMTPVAATGTTHIDPQDPIIFHIEGMLLPLKLQPSEQTVIGRLNPRNPRRPDLDMTPFGGFEKGVSNTHAVLIRQEHEAMISDLGSTNGTFVNGKRLEPHTRHVLHSGDELRLGKMMIRVHFGAATV